MKRLQEISRVGDSDTELQLMEILRDAFSEILLCEGKMDNARFKKFFNSNKELVKDATVIALSDFAKYNKNTRRTVTLHAKDAHERRTIGNIIDALVASKKFKIQKTKFHGSRKMWIMRKI